MFLSLFFSLFFGAHALASGCPETKIEIVTEGDRKFLLIHHKYYSENNQLVPAPPDKTEVQCDKSGQPACVDVLAEAKAATIGCVITTRPKTSSLKSDLSKFEVSQECNLKIRRRYQQDKNKLGPYFAQFEAVCGAKPEGGVCFSRNAVSHSLNPLTMLINAHPGVDPYRLEFFTSEASQKAPLSLQSCQMKFCGGANLAMKKFHEESIRDVVTNCGERQTPEQLNQFIDDFSKDWNTIVNDMNSVQGYDLSGSPNKAFYPNGARVVEIDAGNKVEIKKLNHAEWVMLIPQTYKDERGNEKQAAPIVLRNMFCYETNEALETCRKTASFHSPSSGPYDPAKIQERLKHCIHCDVYLNEAKNLNLKDLDSLISRLLSGDSISTSVQSLNVCSHEGLSTLAIDIQTKVQGIEREAQLKIENIRHEAEQKIRQILEENSINADDVCKK